MTCETEWRSEWAALRAERELARRRWRSAADGLAARMHDPLRLGGLVHDHPVAAGGIGAVIGAFLVKWILGRARARPDEASHAGGPAPRASMWTNVLGDAALGIAVPWLMRTLKSKFGWDFEPGAAAQPSREPPPAAEPGTGSTRP